MSVHRRLIPIAGALLIVALPARAVAATISFSSAFTLPSASGGGNPESSAVFFVPQFNLALGTLDAIDYTVVRGGLDFNWTVDNEGSMNRTLVDPEPALRTSLHYLGGQLDSGINGFQFDSFDIVLFDIDLEPDFTGDDAHTYVGTFSPITLSQVIVDPFLLGVFTGTGSVPIETRALFLPDAIAPSLASDVTLSASAVQWFIQYEYTPAVVDPGPGPGPGPSPVPEPATLSLVGLGAAALGLTRRRRRRVTSER
jgi:hypothetical protein